MAVHVRRERPVTDSVAGASASNSVRLHGTRTGISDVAARLHATPCPAVLVCRMDVVALIELTLPETDMDKVQDRFFDLGRQVRELCAEAGVGGTVMVSLDGLIEKY